MIRIKRTLATLSLVLALVILHLPAGTTVAAASTTQVLTIYFCGTGATSDWYLAENTSWHNTPELIASLYQNDDSQPITKTSYFGGLVYSISTELGHSHYKYIVDGIGTDFFSLIGQIDPDFGVRGWDACEDEAYLALDLVADPGDNIILNLIGWSRGGILTMKTARRVAADTRVGKINILAYDPVPGGFDPVGRFGDDLRLPAKVNQFIGIYARDERSYMFDPVIPDMSELPGTSKVWLVTVPGSHETMMGNFQDDGHSMTPIDLLGLLDWTVNEGMRPVNKVARAVAEQLLSSWEWGEVPIKELAQWNNQDDFLGLINEMYAYDYWFARGVSFLPGWSSHDGLYWLTGRDHQLRIYWLTPVLHGRLCFVAPNRHAPEWVGLVWFPNVEQVYWLDQIAGGMNGTAWNILQSFRNCPPTAEAGPDRTVNEGDIVQFDGTNSLDPEGGPLTFFWEFGDGETSTLAQPTHTYTDNGAFTVTLSVTDDSGKAGADTAQVTVNNVAPTASIDSVDQPNPQFILPLVHTLTFNGSFTDPGWLDTHNATWDFGDGTVVAGTLTEENTQPDSTGNSTSQHVYPAPGDYTVTLSIIDDDGGVGTDTRVMTVISSEEAILVVNNSIQELPDDAFKNNSDKRKNAFSEKLGEVIELIDAGAYQEAIDKLQNDIRAKADGYVDGNPKNDWITDREAQEEICTMIDDLIAYLETLL